MAPTSLVTTSEARDRCGGMGEGVDAVGEAERDGRQGGEGVQVRRERVGEFYVRDVNRLPWYAGDTPIARPHLMR